MLLEEKNIFNALCPRSPVELAKRLKEEPEFKRLLKKRSQVESLISILKHVFLWRTPKAKGYEHRAMQLTRIFHTDRHEEAAKLDETRQTSIWTQGCMGPYCPSQNGSLTMYSSSFPASAVDRYEISGLTPWHDARILWL